MAPCNNVRFTYRGTNLAGQWLAELLSEMSIEYTTNPVNPNASSAHVSADLAALIVELDKRVVADQVAEEASVGMASPTIQVAVPTVHVRDRNVLQWLRAMNVPIGVPITLQFVDDRPF